MRGLGSVTAWLFAGVFLAPACGVPDRLTDRCVNDSDCVSGRACTEGHCGPRAQSSAFDLPEVSADVAEACSGWAQTECNKEQTCADPVWIQASYADPSACQRVQELHCREDLTAPGSTDSVRRRAQCADALSQQKCSDWLVGAPTSCANYDGYGSLAEGAACRDSSQCSSDLYCAMPAGAACGVCTATLNDGDACTDDGSCQAYSECFAGHCQAQLALGMACGTGRGHCQFGLGCSHDVCAEYPSWPGDSCGDDESCDAYLGSCNSQLSVCEAFHAANPGDSCDPAPNSTARAVCVGGSTCGAVAGSGALICQRDLPLGAGCTFGAVPQCAAPARCVQGVCTVVAVAHCL